MKNLGITQVHNVKRRRQMADLLGKHLDEPKAFETPVADLTAYDEEAPPEKIGIVTRPSATFEGNDWVSDKFKLVRLDADQNFGFNIPLILPASAEIIWFDKDSKNALFLSSDDQSFLPIIKNFQATSNKNSTQQLELVQAVSVLIEAYIQTDPDLQIPGDVSKFTAWATHGHDADKGTTETTKKIMTRIGITPNKAEDLTKNRRGYRLMLGALNVVLAKMLRSGLAWSFDDTEENYRENIKSIQQVKSNLEFLKRLTEDIVQKIRNNSGNLDKYGDSLKSDLETMLQTVLKESIALMDRDRRISDVERENTALKRDLYIQRSRQNAVIGARKEAYEMLLRQETMLFLEAMNIPSYRFATLVAGFLTMMYYNSVLKIDYFTYIISRSKDSTDTSLFDDVMLDPLKSRLEMDKELEALSPRGSPDLTVTSNLMEWFDNNGDSQIKGKFLTLRYFIYKELKVFKPLYSQDQLDTHNYGHLMLTPMIISARTTAWNLIQNLLQEARSRNASGGFSSYGGECDRHMCWMFTHKDEKAVRLMGLMARLTATKYTEFQLTKGHTTQNDKVERIVITESLELEIRKCLQDMGFNVASNAFTASFPRR